MSFITDRVSFDNAPEHRSLLDEPEHAALLRLTKLVEHLFRVPIAYLALLGTKGEVASRIGSGQEHWGFLQAFPFAGAFAEPLIWREARGTQPDGFDPGDIRFAAAASLRSTDGLELGLLVIADVEPRPEFSLEDLNSLTELARVLAGKMELRLMACEAREAAALAKEAENRFRSIANAAPIMIIYSGVDGGCSFVNKRWLEFSGRVFEDELGDGFADTFHPDHRDRVMQAYWKAFDQRRPVTIEFPMLRRDGEYRWMRSDGVPRFDAVGRCEGFIGCFVDLAEHKPLVPNGKAIFPEPAEADSEPRPSISLPRA